MSLEISWGFITQHLDTLERDGGGLSALCDVIVCANRYKERIMREREEADRLRMNLMKEKANTSHVLRHSIPSTRTLSQITHNTFSRERWRKSFAIYLLSMMMASSESIGETFITSSRESIRAGACRIPPERICAWVLFAKGSSESRKQSWRIHPLPSSYMAFVLFQKVLAEVYFTWLVIISPW